jgi:hypothetical protein
LILQPGALGNGLYEGQIATITPIQGLIAPLQGLFEANVSRR